MILIKNAHIVNEGENFKGSLLIDGDTISRIFRDNIPADIEKSSNVIDASGKILIPGVIDTHVHFRDPGFPEKADFDTESRAAVAGGVTSVLDMPNTKPQTTTLEAWEQKCHIAEEKSFCNYGFFIGATNNNIEELKRADYTKICGVKLFLGSSTGGMLVNDESTIDNIFRSIPSIIMIHAEDEEIINRNKEHYQKLYNNEVPIECHSMVRSTEACFKASEYAVKIARRTGARVHIAHISTEKELSLFENKPLDNKRITSETCPHYLYFSNLDYKKHGARVKCNPAIKSEADRKSLILALSTNKIDTIGTDHAPHLLSDKDGFLFKAASGMPSIQYALPAMMQLVVQGQLSLTTLVEKMCHNPATIFNIEKRGFIREGYKADLTLIDKDSATVVTTDNILSKCKWSPYQGMEFRSAVDTTIVNGTIAYSGGTIRERVAQPLTFKNR